MQEYIDKLSEDVKLAQRKRFSKQVARLEQELTGTGLWDTFKGLECFVAGGFWTSVFTGAEINDVDVYFRDIKSLNTFIASCFSRLEDDSEDEDENIFVKDLDNLNIDWALGLHCVGYTDKSVIFQTKAGLTIQCIHTKFYQSPKEIFDTFDYTINMCAYDFKDDMLVMDDNFLPDLAARRLIVNPKTSFPIISQLRIDKYKQRGYHINRKEFLKLSCAVAALNLSTWDEAIGQLAGMYGWCIDEVFDKTKPFTMSELIEQLDNLEYKEEAVVSIKIGYYDEIIDVIAKQHKGDAPSLKQSYYKRVKSTGVDGVFKSWHSPSFEYKLGETVQCEKRGIYLFKSKRLANKSSYGDVLIRLESEHFDEVSLKPDCGDGKYLTTDELRVVEVTSVKGGNAPQPICLPL